MPFDDMFDDGETQPRPAAFPASRGIGPIEAFRQPRQVFAGNSLPMIVDAKRDPVRVTPGADFNHRTGRIATITNGVADQIVQQLNELATIAANRGQLLRQIDP